ncbi:MAG: transporter substrate-binding domain-containing protein [Lachnospiraceae bacterium]|nr:transporter substrate-binding domain-containing protein [Lachnospiraceae bacterium]
MKKKKVLSLVLVAGMVVSMTACGSSSSSDASKETPEEVEVSVEEEVISVEDEAADEAAGETVEESDADSDAAYVTDKGTLVVGITDFEPMDYQDENGDWIGFDADMATAFGEYIGVDVEFQEIDWDNKILELDGKSIDCVWNGMTLTDEVTSSMECSNAYCNNQQVVVVPAEIADDYQDVDSLSSLSFAVEAGSAGEEQAEEYGLDYTPVETQSNALMEVAAGTSDAAIIDLLMAAAMIGEGTSYDDMTYTVGLNDEKYGVGFRQGSDLAQELNDFFTASYEDGTMMSIAETYGVQASIIEP